MAEGMDILQVPSDLKEDVESAKRFIDEHTDQIGELEAGAEGDATTFALMLAELKRVREQADEGAPVNGAGIVAPVDDDGDENLEGSPDFDYTRFRLDYGSSSTVIVNAGQFILNGTSVFNKLADITISGTGNDIDGYGGAFGGGTNYVYFELDNDGVAYTDPTVAPQRLLITCSSSAPSDSLMRQKYIMIGTFSATGGVVTESSIIRFRIKDHDRLTVVPDGNLFPEKQYPLKTTEYSTDDVGQLQVYDANNTELIGVQDWADKTGFPRLQKDANYGGEIEWYGIDSEHTSSNRGSLDFATEPGAEQLLQVKNFDTGTTFVDIQLYSEFAGTANETNKYTLLARINNGTSPDVAYVSLEDFKAKYAEHADEAQIVLTLPSHILSQHIDHLPTGGHLVGENLIPIGIDSDHWDWQTLAQAGLEFWGIGGGYNGVIADGTACWGLTIGRGSAGGNLAIDLENSTLYSDNDPLASIKAYDWDARILYNINGSAVLDHNTTGWGLTFEATNKWTEADFAIEVTGDANLAPTGELQINGTAGVTVANWLTKGIATGTNVIEINADELRDTDKILVVR